MKEVIMRLTPKEFEQAEHAEIVQELVRCKDCRWWDAKEDGYKGYCHAAKHGYYSGNWEIGIYRLYGPEFFCADGERRGDEDGFQKTL